LLHPAKELSDLVLCSLQYLSLHTLDVHGRIVNPYEMLTYIWGSPVGKKLKSYATDKSFPNFGEALSIKGFSNDGTGQQYLDIVLYNFSTHIAFTRITD